MTHVPRAIASDAPLRDAQQLMRSLSLQQLPVQRDGALHGVLLERDLLLARQLGVNFDTSLVGSLPSHDAFSVMVDESLACAVRAMASRAAACAVVFDEHEVCGILSAASAMRVLAELLEAERAESARESAHCPAFAEGGLLSRAESSAHRLLSADPDAQAEDDLHELRSAVRELYEERSARAEAEARELVCAQKASLRRAHLEQLHGAHKLQAQLLEGVLMGLDDMAQPVRALAVNVKRAVATLREDFERDRESVRFTS